MNRQQQTSLDAYAKTDKATGRDRVTTALINRGASTYSELVYYTGMKLPSVVGRINELRYEYQTVIADGKRNGKTIYRLRKDNEPPDDRPKKQIELLIEDLIEFADNSDYYTAEEIFKIIKKYARNN